MDTTKQKKTKVTQELPKITWSDKTIENLEKTHSELEGRPTLTFDAAGHLKGMKLRWNTNTGSKTFVIYGKFKKKTFNHKCGQFQKGITGISEVESYVNDIVKKHKDRSGEWISNPNDELVTPEIIEEDQKLTIRECIESVAEAGFPRIKVEGYIDAQSIKEYTRRLFGHNERRDYLNFSNNENGGVVTLKDGYTFEKLFKKFPEYKGCTHETYRSLYDSQLGGLEISKLTVKAVQHYCNKEKTMGGRQNELKAFQYLFRASNKLNLISGEMLDPTRISNNGVEITKGKKTAHVTKYNNVYFKLDQIEKLADGCMQLRDKHPFRAEAVMFILYSMRRETETLKIHRDMLYHYNGKHNKEVITLPHHVHKNKTSFEPEHIIITDNIRSVLDSLDYQLAKPEHRKLQLVKWLFPNPRVSSVKLADVEYCKEDDTRIKFLGSIWRDLKKLTGIDGAKKSFRKSGYTIGKRSIGADKMVTVGGWKSEKTPNTFYDKSDIEDKKEYAKEFAKVYKFNKS